MDHNSSSNMAENSGKLKILSLNVRGLRNKRKRRILFHSFKNEKCDIICLQETHLLKSDSHIIKKEWPFDFHISEGTNNSMGLLTLFGNKIDSSNTFFRYSNQRCLVSQFLFNNQKFSLSNIYAPCTGTTGKLEFFERTKPILKRLFFR